ncbi:MAG: hypothetical protein AAF721_23135 [Myxococcota bacterium]
MMTPAVHEVLTLATVALSIAWLVRHFWRRPATCDGCSVPKPTRRGIRPAALRVLQGRGGGRA